MEVKPILHFDFDIILHDDEIMTKGYCRGFVVLPDFSKYKVCFYDSVRLGQDLKDENYIAEPGLIIINEVTKANMEYAIYELWLDGFFDEIKSFE